MPDTTGEGLPVQIKERFTVLFLNDRMLQDGHGYHGKNCSRRGEAERTIIAFQSERTFHVEMKGSSANSGSKILLKRASILGLSLRPLRENAFR